MLGSVYFIAAVISIFCIIFYTISIRLPSCLRMLRAYQRSTYESDSTFTIPPHNVKLPTAWNTAEGFHLGITDESVYMSRKFKDKWICIDVNKVAASGDKTPTI